MTRKATWIKAMQCADAYKQVHSHVSKWEDFVDKFPQLDPLRPFTISEKFNKIRYK